MTHLLFNGPMAFANASFSLQGGANSMCLSFQPDFSVRHETFISGARGQYLSVWSVDPHEWENPAEFDRFCDDLTELHWFYGLDPSIDGSVREELGTPTASWVDRQVVSGGDQVFPVMDGSLDGYSGSVRCLILSGLVIGYITPDVGFVKSYGPGGSREAPSQRFVFWWSSEGNEECQRFNVNLPASPFVLDSWVLENGGLTLTFLPGVSVQN